MPEPKDGHRWIRIQPAQQVPAKFPSIYRQAGWTEVNREISLCTTSLLDHLCLICAVGANEYILMAEKPGYNSSAQGR